MKRINIILAVLLIIAAAFVYDSAKKLSALKETETQLTQETASMQEELETAEKSFDAKQAELSRIKEENTDKLEALEVWQNRTAELQELLKD